MAQIANRGQRLRSLTAAGDKWIVFAPVLESGRCSAALAEVHMRPLQSRDLLRPAAGKQ